MPGNDNKRFCVLIEPHLEALFRAAFRLVRNRADAEDLVQDTCLRAYARLGELQESAGVKAWLLRVMHNLFVDGVRRAKVSPISSQENVVQADVPEALERARSDSSMEVRRAASSLIEGAVTAK